MLELVIGPENGVIINASIPITWCLDKETLKSLSIHNNPQILFELEYEDGYTKDRFLEKLSSYMAYIPCRRPGKVKISAYIVTSTNMIRSQRSIMKKVFLIKDGNTFEYRVFDKELNYEYHYDKINKTNDYAMVLDRTESPHIVNIPKDVFGKELPPWFKFAVNRYLENTTFDQCHQRQRIISLFMFRMWPLIIETIFWELRMLVIYLIAFAFGHYHIDMSRLFKPFDLGTIKMNVMLDQDIKSGNIIDIICEYFKKLSIKLKIKRYTPNTIAYWGLGFLAPLIPIIYLIYLPILNILLHSHNYNILFLIFGPFILNIILVCCVMLITLICRGFISIIVKTIGLIFSVVPGASFNFINSVIDKFESWIYNKFRKNKDLKIELLTCNGDPKNVIADIKRIPFTERSLSLIYSDIKNHICKPMSR